MPIIDGTGLGHPITNAGAPVAGTDEIQTITIGGTPTSGSFKLTFEGFTTSAITWTAVDATLVAAIDAALGALPTIGSASNVTTAAGTLSSGIGTVTVTFVAALGKTNVALMTATSSLVGTNPTVAVTTTTAGVTATARGAPKGATLIDVTNALHYTNTGTAAAPTWTKTGTQS